MYTVVISLQCLAIAVLLFEIVYIAFQTPSKLQVSLMVMTISTLIMMIGYLMEVRATSQDAALLGKSMAYLGKPFLMLASMLFVSCYCRINLRRWLTTIMVIFASMFSLIVFTNDFHHLYYATVAFDRSRTYSPLITTHGSLYYVFSVSILFYMAADGVLAFREYRRTKDVQFRKQTWYIFGMIIAGMCGYLLYLSGITNGYDSTMGGSCIATILLFFLFIRCRLFDAMSLAKDQALNDAHNGILVLDNSNKVVYKNLMMEQYLERGLTLGEFMEMEDGRRRLFRNDHVYQAEKKSVMERERRFGCTVEIDDITDVYRYSARLEADVESRTKEIQQIQRSIICSFADLVEARDDSTGMHVKKTSAYVEILAKGLQRKKAYPQEINDLFVRIIADVAPLHDIGKLSIPDSILMKPGKLDPAEFDIIKTHTEKGLKIVNDTIRGVETEAYTKMAGEVVYSHHERWDGKGYPKGLKDEEIPLAARIMAVADVYDAVRSARCYKPPYDLIDAKRIIVEGSGTQFDPVVVEAFLDCIDEIEQV